MGLEVKDFKADLVLDGWGWALSLPSKDSLITE